MTRTRRVFAAVAWLFLACVVVQFFLVGLRAFDVRPWTHLHVDFPYVFGWLSPLLVLLAVAADASRHARRLTLVLLLLFALQTYLPLVARTDPWIAGFHAANALVVGWVAWRLAVAATNDPGTTGTPRR